MARIDQVARQGTRATADLVHQAGPATNAVEQRDECEKHRSRRVLLPDRVLRDLLELDRYLLEMRRDHLHLWQQRQRQSGATRHNAWLFHPQLSFY